MTEKQVRKTHATFSFASSPPQSTRRTFVILKGVGVSFTRTTIGSVADTNWVFLFSCDTVCLEIAPGPMRWGLSILPLSTSCNCGTSLFDLYFSHNCYSDSIYSLKWLKHWVNTGSDTVYWFITNDIPMSTVEMCRLSPVGKGVGCTVPGLLTCLAVRKPPRLCPWGFLLRLHCTGMIDAWAVVRKRGYRKVPIWSNAAEQEGLSGVFSIPCSWVWGRTPSQMGSDHPMSQNRSEDFFMSPSKTEREGRISFCATLGKRNSAFHGLPWRWSCEPGTEAVKQGICCDII